MLAYDGNVFQISYQCVLEGFMKNSIFRPPTLHSSGTPLEKYEIFLKFKNKIVFCTGIFSARYMRGNVGLVKTVFLKVV